jgi:hypothetical protein
VTTEEPEPRPRLGAGRLAAILLAVALNALLIVAIVIIASNPQRLADQLAVWRYTPTAVVAGYAERAAMTDEGRFLFYASRPQVESGSDFDRICSTHLEDVGVLGCYVHDTKRIHLFDVTDDRLDGMEEVVAAHEMLHAVWDRMGRDERERIEALVETEAASRTDDEQLAETLDFYAEAEPGQRANELHSILGTEYADLSPELEQHYARYFDDRSAVVAMHERSNAVFVQQQQAIDGLVAQLESLTASIDADYAAYNAGYDQLNADIRAFNARVDAGELTKHQYDREVDAFNARQAELDAVYAGIQARADEHAALLVQLDELNAQVDELNQSINIEPRDAG